MSEMKSRVKLKVTGFGDNHRCTVLGQVKIGFFYETIYQRELTSGGNNIDVLIQRAKDAIAAFKSAGFNEEGVIDL